MQQSFNVLILNILIHVSALQNAVIRESIVILLRWVLNVVETIDILTITPPVTIYCFHLFSDFYNIGHLSHQDYD
jgi:hypothetical protein